MLTQQQMESDRLLECLAEALDITPTDYQRAVKSYTAVGNWLKEGFAQEAYQGSHAEPAIYPQGSINLGTIIRPFRDGKERDFDVDLVCELQTLHTQIAPKHLKEQTGKRLHAHETYSKKLDEEGKRCWTINYAESEGVGFHIDVLPCAPDLAIAGAPYSGAIRITHKHKPKDIYEWRPSNPKGYAKWFFARNTTFANFAAIQKPALYRTAQGGGSRICIFESVAAIPDQLVRTPLQRTIQLMKRHRDMRFAKNPDVKPISIIINTVAATLYAGETDIYSTFTNIVDRLAMHRDLVENQNFSVNAKVASLKLITRTGDGKWWVPNPANPHENFADRWHEDNHARARAFFDWVQQIARDVQNIPTGKGIPEVARHLNPIFGQTVTAAGVEKLGEPFQTSRKSSGQERNTTGVIANSASLARVAPSTSRQVSRFAVAHRDDPYWPVQPFKSVAINAMAFVNHDGFRTNQFRVENDAGALPKRAKIRFYATTDVTPPYEVHWQIVNTGTEATVARNLRGRIILGSLEHEEDTQYCGMHWVECFIVKNGACVARSGEFVVNIA